MTKKRRRTKDPKQDNPSLSQISTEPEIELEPCDTISKILFLDLDKDYGNNKTKTKTQTKFRLSFRRSQDKDQFYYCLLIIVCKASGISDVEMRQTMLKTQK